MSMYDVGGAYPLWGESKVGARNEEPWQTEFPLMRPEDEPTEADVESYQKMVRELKADLEWHRIMGGR